MYRAGVVVGRGRVDVGERVEGTGGGRGGWGGGLFPLPLSPYLL